MDKEVDLTVPDQQELSYVLGSSGILSGYNSDTYGVESWLLNDGSPQSEVIKPCLKMDLRIQFIDGYEHYVGWFRELHPALYRVVFLLGICASIITVYCLFEKT